MTHPLVTRNSSTPGLPALVEREQRWTWEGLFEETSRYAMALHETLGVGEGSRIATYLEGSSTHVMLIHAVGLLGAVIIPFHRRWTAREVEEAARLTGTHVLVTDPPAARHFRRANMPDTCFVSVDERGNLHGLPAKRRSGPSLREAIDAFHLLDENSIAVILPTSGSTGHPKFVPLTWANLRAAAKASDANLRTGISDNWLCPLPLSHTGGLSILYRAVFSGCAVTLSGGASPADLARTIRAGAVTIVSLVPLLLRRVMDADPSLTAHECTSLRAILLGGAAAPRTVIEEARRRSLPVLLTYGLTEAGSQVATMKPGDRLEIGCVGKPLPGFTVEIRDAGGRGLSHGMKGDIWIGGPAVFSGYLDGGDAERFSGGMFKTGDTGFFDALGRLHVVGRSDDMIVSGGENISPEEIEDVLRALPGMEDACIVGLPDEEWGETVAALVVPERGEEDFERLREECHRVLAPFKVPKRWLSARAVPLTESGKPDREAVRRLFLTPGC
ncbi:MAG: class I adenylate-forming enzyme family protein [Bacteroidota bacterium]|nr:class I adenylate-forming enzyme family protein [Bacteroidota bacterium]